MPSAREFAAVCLLAAVFASGVRASESVPAEGDRRWNARSIQLSLSRSLFRQSTAIKTGSSVNEAVEAAAASWSNVSAVGFRFVESELESVNDSRSGGDGKSLVTVAATAENVALFPKESGSPPALTRLFYNRQGSIIEADVVLNPFLHFSTDGTPGTFDLQSVITHELGHVLGLGHSPVMSARMYGRMSQNREDQVEAFPSRLLSRSDISMVRALYGPAGAEVDCCASVAGTGIGKSLVVWVEEASSGRVVAADVFSGGRYILGGFPSDRYRIFAQSAESGAAIRIVEREIELPTRLKDIAFGPVSDAHISFLGLNGELSSLPVRVARGRTFQIYLGGVGLDPKHFSFGFSTSAISVVNGTVTPIDYGRGISAVALTVNIDADIPEGDYSIFVESRNGVRRYMIGAISVD